MRRLSSITVLFVTGATWLSAQESGTPSEPSAIWKWANFVLLVAGLGYLMAKMLPPLFKSRTEEIQKGIAEARAIKQDADRRAAEVDARTAALGADIQRFRVEAKAEMQQEGERIRQETAAQIARLEIKAQQEIEISGKIARRELKSYAAKLSLDLAEQRVRERLDGKTEQGLVDAFIEDLERESEEFMISVVAARYAAALADVVTGGVHASNTAQADPAEITAQLRVVDDLIGSSNELKNALASPAVTPSRKRAVMARLLEPMNVSAQVRNFLFVVIDHRRVHELKSIIEAFENLADQRLGFVRADVTSATEMPEAQRKALEAQLSRLAGKKTRLRYTTDPALVAGVVAKVGSTVYDGSVRGQLERLRLKLGSQ